MYNELIEKFLDFDESQRDEAWATELVKQVLLNANPVIDKAEYDRRKKILFGQFNESDLNRVFTGKTMERLKKKLSSSFVPFFERVRTALIADRDQTGLTITVDSLDPEKEMRKKKDKDLLINRKAIEALLNGITANNGMPPKKFTSEDYNGNMEKFDEMGLNEQDPDDLNFFLDTHWGLKAEIELSKVINPVARINQLSRKYNRYINDILIDLTIFSQISIDQVEGKIKIEDIRPYAVDVLHASGDTNDFKEAQAFNIRHETNIRGFMRKFGAEFDFANRWSELISAVYSGDARGISGITDETGDVMFGALIPGKTCVNIHTFMDMPIKYGRCEFKTVTRERTQLAVNENGNLIKSRVTKIDPTNSVNVDEKSAEDTYYAYYFNITGVSPILVKWGKVYMQNFEGLHDEYSGFTIKGNRTEGVPVATTLEPFHNMIQVSFKMTEMLINDVKPDGLLMNYSSILKVAEFLKTNSKDAPADQMSGIEMFLKMVEESPNILADSPETEEGQPMGGGNLGVQPNKKGLNSAANDLIKIIDWAELKVEKYLGTQGIDIAEPRDGYKLSLENKKRARSATAFIDTILLAHLEDINITVLLYAQDISKFPNITAYKYLESLVGEKVMGFLKTLEKAAHRYGIVLNTFNNDIQKAEIIGEAQQALRNKEISFQHYMAIRSFDSEKAAASYLAREKQIAEKKQQQNALTALQQQEAVNQKTHERAMQLENLKGEWLEKARQQQAQGFIGAAQINSQAQIQREVLQNEGQNQRLASQAINDIDKIAETANKEAQKPV